MTAPITEAAPAKINLTLAVLGRRADGFHQLDSLVVFARDVADTLSFEPGLEPAVAVTGPFAAGIVGENLVWRALQVLAAVAPRLRLGRVVIDKRLPVAAGIGGGSADAAALLRAVRRASPGLETQVDWHGLAASLGSDVPVCLRDQPTRVAGTGERLSPFLLAEPLAAVLANPRCAVPADKTARVFRALGLERGAQGPGRPAPLPEHASPDALLSSLRSAGNDLTAPATHVLPAIAEVLAALEATEGVRLARLSGAGPTCFGLCDGMAAARLAAAALEAAHPGWWVRATALG